MNIPFLIMLQYLIRANFNSCVANSSCCAFQVLRSIQDSTGVIPLSRLFLYWNARVPEKETNQDGGCYIHDALASLTTLGICEESKWQYNENEVLVQPPIDCYKQGNDNQIDSFYQITSVGVNRGNDIETAIRANHPVIFGTLVSNQYAGYGGDGAGMVWNIPNDLDIDGGHAQCVVGVRQGTTGREFLVRNSWGVSWSDNGCAWFTEAYMEWNQTNDLFVPTLMPNLLV